MGATDPAQELNITVPSVRRRFNGKWLAFLLPKGTARERERSEPYTHTQTHRHTRIPQPARKEEASRQDGQRGRVESEQAPKQSCASRLQLPRAQAACLPSALLPGDFTFSLSPALLSLRLRTLTMPSQFPQVNRFKSCYFALSGPLGTLVLALFQWLGAQEEGILRFADLGEGILHCRAALPQAGTFSLLRGFFFLLYYFSFLNPSLPNPARNNRQEPQLC